MICKRIVYCYEFLNEPELICLLTGKLFQV